MSTQTPMQEIEGACRLFRDHHDRLAAELQALNDERDAMVKRRIGAVRVLVQNLAKAESQLKGRIEAVADQFEKPRTQIFHGIRVGLQKGLTVLEWDSDALVVARIREYQGKKAPVLIVRPDEYPSKSALKNLSSDQLEKIGVREKPGRDKTVIKPVDSQVDRMVNALLKTLRDDIADSTAEPAG